MSDQLALWDRLMALTAKAQSAADAFGELPPTGGLDGLAEKLDEKNRIRLEEAKESASSILHLLLGGPLGSTDGASVTERYRILREEVAADKGSSSVDLPFADIFTDLEEGDEDEETLQRVGEAKNALFHAFRSLIRTEVEPNGEESAGPSLFGARPGRIGPSNVIGINSLQWLERQKALNRREKKQRRENVDTRASKGRKTRYVEIPQLVNFFPATPERIPWTQEKRNELFKSLFD